MFIKYLKEEFKFSVFNRNIIMLLLVAPLALPIWFAGTYTNNYLNNIPLAVMDADNSDLSNTITQYFASNERFNIAYYVSTKLEIEQLIEQNKVFGGVYIPEGLGKNIKNGTPTNVVLFTNGTNVVISNNIYAGAATIVQTVAGGASIKLISAKGNLSQEQSQNIFFSFKTGERVLFDPKMTYMNYLILGLITVIFQQLAISAMSVLISRNPTELNDRHMLLRLASKCCVCIVGFTGSFSLVITILHYLFGVPITGNILSAYFLSILFIVALLCPIVFLSALFKNNIKMAQVCFTLSMPIFLTSGYIWPLEQSPKILVYVVKILWPYINYGRPFSDILIKNTSIVAFIPNMLELLAYTAIWMPICIAFYKYRYRDCAIITKEIGVGLPD